MKVREYRDETEKTKLKTLSHVYSMFIGTILEIMQEL
jgi:hypothetical protein